MVGLWFAVAYFGSDWITAQRAVSEHLPSVATRFDALVPFWPNAAWVYMTISPLLLLPLLLLQSRSVIVVFAAVLCAEIALACIVYFFYPVAQNQSPDVAVPYIMRIADQINLTYNSLPSLHVALSVTAAGAALRRGHPLRNFALVLWAVAIMASTLLTHQHFIADVVAGFVLACLGMAAFSRLSLIQEAAD